MSNLPDPEDLNLNAEWATEKCLAPIYFDQFKVSRESISGILEPASAYFNVSPLALLLPFSSLFVFFFNLLL